MEKRQRSPNYPAVSLKDAVEKLRTLVAEIGQSTTTRDVVAKAMGYSGLSGASATTISAMNKYGLLEGRGDDVRVTDRAMAIVRPLSDAERDAALRDAALEPPLFRELAEKFKGMNLNVELFRNYLVRNGFNSNGAETAISAYKETIEFVGGLDRAHDLHRTPDPEPTMEAHHAAAPNPTNVPAVSTAAASAAASPGSSFEEEKKALDEGPAVLVLPKNLSPESVDDLEYWLQGVLRRMKRRASAPETDQNE